VNSQRVLKRLDRRPRARLSLSNYLPAGAVLLNPARTAPAGHLSPEGTEASLARLDALREPPPLLLVEIPSDLQSVKTASPDLALAWRMHTRTIFHRLFGSGYLVTDFLFIEPASLSSFYVLSFGEASLGGHEG
jgi:predicted GNAT superfamily acetyltransferase